MGTETGIAWCDATFNPWVGCTKVSPGCDHCYAEGWAKRTGQTQLWQGDRRRTSAANWTKMVAFNKVASLGAFGAHRPRVFVASLADVFDNQVPEEWRHDLWALIERLRSIEWLLLTKRPQNVQGMLPETWGPGWSHVSLGTTVENQQEAVRRVPLLRAAPSDRRFLSCEPLLGPVRLNLDGIDWVIVGGESGFGARPMARAWAEDLIIQCQEAEVPVFFKQAGSNRGPEWPPEIKGKGDDPDAWPPTLRVQQLHPDPVPF